MRTPNQNETPSAAADKIAHTPGPWTICEIRGASDKDNVYVEDANGNLVTSVMAYGPFNPDAILEGRANARLIAAAPELLEACKELIATMNSVRRYGAIEKIRAAISKAEGK